MDGNSSRRFYILFQAEHGIRDDLVTGVQTCALPISDHVDAHRSVALVASPYVRRHSVDSALYTTAGMLRTMELVLGLPPMSQYDASAAPFYGSRSEERRVGKGWGYSGAASRLRAGDI